MIDRRRFLLSMASAGGGVALLGAAPLGLLARAGAPGRDGLPPDAAPDRFLIVLFYSGGLDPNYLFDARPLAMTAAGLQGNAEGIEPTAWESDRGAPTWAGPATEALRPHRASFSVVNGVVMTPTFDGHDQSANVLFTGHPFGGELFLPHLNSPAPGMPLDGVQFGEASSGLAFTNLAATVPLTLDSADALIARVTGTPALLAPEDRVRRFLDGRLAALGGGEAGSAPGGFARGARELRHALGDSPRLARALGRIRPPPPTVVGDPDELAPTRRLHAWVTELFRAGAARTALIHGDLGGDVDTHAGEDAVRQPVYARRAARQVAALIEHLRATPFDETRSMLEVTTFVMASEFARTMRQNGSPMESTGTDHNPLANSILVGGAGIRGGLVLGASDFRTAEERLSPAHLARDPGRRQKMGRPFDFESFAVLPDARPDLLRMREVLTCASVVNTLYSRFDIPRARWRSAEAGAPAAPALAPLLL